VSWILSVAKWILSVAKWILSVAKNLTGVARNLTGVARNLTSVKITCETSEINRNYRSEISERKLAREVSETNEKYKWPKSPFSQTATAAGGVIKTVHIHIFPVPVRTVHATAIRWNV